MSPDGNRLYFTSMRPASGSGPKIEHPDIWYVDRSGDGWGDPVRFPDHINTDGRELYPSESKDGFVYFFSNREGGYGGSDVWRAPIKDDGFGEPENLGPGVNTAAGEGDPCISPEGDYIVFSSRREGGIGDGDLYVSFKLPDGKWSEAQNLGAPVNTEHLEFCPSVSRDGKYLFFTSRRPKATEIPSYRNTARDELGVKPNPDRGDIDIYWIDARYLERFRPKSKE
jgi:Tol biopolymer transport system component